MPNSSEPELDTAGACLPASPSEDGSCGVRPPSEARLERTHTPPQRRGLSVPDRPEGEVERVVATPLRGSRAAFIQSCLPAEPLGASRGVGSAGLRGRPAGALLPRRGRQDCDLEAGPGPRPQMRALEGYSRCGTPDLREMTPPRSAHRFFLHCFDGLAEARPSWGDEAKPRRSRGQAKPRRGGAEAMRGKARRTAKPKGCEAKEGRGEAMRDEARRNQAM